MWSIKSGRGFGCGILEWVWFYCVPKICFMNLATTSAESAVEILEKFDLVKMLSLYLGI